MTLDYNTHLNSEAYRAKRLLVRKRAKNVCEWCFLNQGSECHHLTYVRFGDELLTDLLWVCKPCHQILDEKRRCKELVTIPKTPKRKKQREYKKQIEQDFKLARILAVDTVLSGVGADFGVP